jgi:iron uptake system EfeUOB component EfeO/EfeM
MHHLAPGSSLRPVALLLVLLAGGCALDNRTGPALANAVAATSCRDLGAAEATRLARASARLQAALADDPQDLAAARTEWAAARAAYDRGAAVFLTAAPDLWPAVDGRLDDPLVGSGLRVLEAALFGQPPAPPPILHAQGAALADATTRLARAVLDPARPIHAAVLISSMAAVAGVAATKADGSDSPYAGLSHKSLEQDLAGLQALYAPFSPLVARADPALDARVTGLLAGLRAQVRGLSSVDALPDKIRFLRGCADLSQALLQLGPALGLVVQAPVDVT